jgi:hypothetical protein
LIYKKSESIWSSEKRANKNNKCNTDFVDRLCREGRRWNSIPGLCFKAMTDKIDPKESESIREQL